MWHALTGALLQEAGAVFRLRHAIALSAVAGAALAAGIGPAMAQPAVAPTVTVGAKSLIARAYGYTFTAFHDGKYSKVTVSGAVTGATSGNVAQLYTQPFPYKKAPAPVAGQQLVLDGTSPESYSFTATPGIATRYSVEILPSTTVSTPVSATSATKVVYVATTQPVTGLKKCGRPVCHETVHIYTRVPASALKAEMPKHLFFYFGIRFSSTGKPTPAWLNLDKSAKISKAKKISSTEFEQTVTFSFRIGNNGYNFEFNYCSKASESSDGVNLPGHHHCGASRVRPSWFLG
jgi:hypothetical protein